MSRTTPSWPISSSRVPASQARSWLPAWIPWEFLRFALVGILGFIVDAGLLNLLLLSGLGFYGGRAISFLAAATATWGLNRSFTFRRNVACGKLRHEWAAYLGLMVLGGAVNYGVYALAIEGSPPVRAHPEFGVALGAVSGMLVNYWNARFLFRRGERSGGKPCGETPGGKTPGGKS
jgi:putative flippase GtrA